MIAAIDQTRSGPVVPHAGVCTAIHDLEDGRMINLATRWLAPRARAKVTVRRTADGAGGTRGSLLQPVTAIDEGFDSAILVEGLADALAAAVMFPESIRRRCERRHEPSTHCARAGTEAARAEWMACSRSTRRQARNARDGLRCS